MAKLRRRGRRQARVLAMLVLYGLAFAPVADRDGLKKAFLFSSGFKDGQETEEQPCEDDIPGGYAWTLVEGVWEKEKALDKVINQFSQHWRVDRIGKIELTLLRLGLYELLIQRLPAKVVTQEALELASLFGADGARTFIYGILDKAAGAKRENGQFMPEDIESAVKYESGTL